MSHPVLHLDLPDDIYERVRRAAKGMKQPVEQALVTIVKAATPSLEKVPQEFRPELEALEDLDDKELWHTTNAKLTSGQQRRLALLLEKNATGTLTIREQQTLQDLRTAADRLLLLRSYAFLLLKYRGHQIPGLMDLRR